MLFTRSSEYALLALSYMAKNQGIQDVEKMSKDLDISKTFLAKVLQTLAKDKILDSFKGVGGGFALSLEPKKIKILDIIQSAEKRKLRIFRCSGGINCCPKNRAHTCNVWPVFHSLQNRVENFLGDLTLQDLIDNK